MHLVATPGRPRQFGARRGSLQGVRHRYNFHAYDSLTRCEDASKRDPRRKSNEAQVTGVMRLLYAASQGDLDELRTVLATGCDPNAADYDGRTALRLAAAEGHRPSGQLPARVGAHPQATDRWGRGHR